MKDSWFTMLCYFLLYSKVNQLDIHIYILFIFFPSMIYHRLLNIPLCTTQLDLLFTHFIHKSLYSLTPTFHSILPLTPAPLTRLFSTFMSLLPFHGYAHLSHISESAYKWCHTVFAFLFLTPLSMASPSCIRVSAMTSLHSVLWLSNSALHVCTVPSSSVHLWMDIYVVSKSWLLWILLLWA